LAKNISVRFPFGLLVSMATINEARGRGVAEYVD